MKRGAKSHIINSLLTSFVQSVRESICPRFFPQTSFLRRSVCTKTSGKYFPVQTSHSVNNQYCLVNASYETSNGSPCLDTIIQTLEMLWDLREAWKTRASRQVVLHAFSHQSGTSLRRSNPCQQSEATSTRWNRGKKASFLKLLESQVTHQVF